MDILPFKCGKLRPRPAAPTPKLASYLLAAPEALPVPPLECRYDKSVTTWPMYGNDTIGDCTCAAAAHMIECWTAAAGVPVVPDLYNVVDAYAAITGYDPTTGTNDNGAAETDVLTYWTTTGICGNQLAAWTAIDPTDFDQLRRAVFLFGGAYIGIELRQSTERQFAGGEAWDYTGTLLNPVVGLHAVSVLGYDSQYFYVCTWGKIQPATQAFLQYQADEAYALVDRAFIAKSGEAPNQLNLQQLQADLQVLNVH